MIDTDPIRIAVLEGDAPLTDAAQVIGAMLDMIAQLHGPAVVDAFIARLNEDLPPQPNHAATDL